MRSFFAKLLFLQCLILHCILLCDDTDWLWKVYHQDVLQPRDISGFNFKRLVELSKLNLRIFERKQAVVDVTGRLETLKLDKDYFVEVDIDTLREKYLDIFVGEIGFRM